MKSVVVTGTTLKTKSTTNIVLSIINVKTFENYSFRSSSNSKS